MADARACGPERGFTVAETLVALLLGCLIAALAVGTAGRQRTLQASLAHRAEALAALRIARHLLGREVRAGDGTEEVGADTLALRAYRGVGVVCAASADPRSLVVHVAGVRDPDPDKDSVRVVGAGGGEAVLALVAREPGASPCAGAGATVAERWTLSGAGPEEPLIARYFERGSYHLDGGALRYRRGAAGRQPITPEVLLTPPSGFRAPGARVVRAELYLPGDDDSTPSLVLSFGRMGAPAGGPPGG